jgi:hypothetical protein
VHRSLSSQEKRGTRGMANAQEIQDGNTGGLCFEDASTMIHRIELTL